MSIIELPHLKQIPRIRYDDVTKDTSLVGEIIHPIFAVYENYIGDKSIILKCGMLKLYPIKRNCLHSLYHNSNCKETGTVFLCTWLNHYHMETWEI